VLCQILILQNLTKNGIIFDKYRQALSAAIHAMQDNPSVFLAFLA
jgi:hypothetical protein